MPMQRHAVTQPLVLGLLIAAITGMLILAEDLARLVLSSAPGAGARSTSTAAPSSAHQGRTAPATR